ncbi:50S ribosomal protein L1 [Neisseria shayeganii 871]|uniref:50S ribosomal protein L1 n=1 Tax=Neisseria shayeganii 871 TaxID=1032488 RepID=G4CLN3_9NEIS|nr:50S ribosomal protein L1 [Neisseria shayeganii 871]
MLAWGFAKVSAGEILFDRCPIKNTVEFDEGKAVEMFFDVVEGVGV